MRFSAATMAILALSADWATAARINGVIGEELEYQLTKNRELYPKASKKTKAASKAAFSCGVSVSGTSSKSSKKSTSDDDSCDTPISVLTCGQTYTGTVTLTTGLVCSEPFGIIMDGSDAVLDCAGNDVVVVGVAAIVLRNGATAMNCQVHSGQGGGVGVLMNEGDATLIDSHIYNKFRGVVIVDDGCRTLTNVRTSDNKQYGVFILEATGTIVMTNLEANGNGDDGVFVNKSSETTLDLFMDGAKLNSNSDNGLSVSDFAGSVTVELFGTVRAIGNRSSGIAMFDSSTLTVNGKLQASSNARNGIVLSGESELAISESGTVIACRNSGGDINGSITAQDGLLIFGKDECASATNKAAECKLELEASQD